MFSPTTPLLHFVLPPPIPRLPYVAVLRQLPHLPARVVVPRLIDDPVKIIKSCIIPDGVERLL